MDGPSSFTINSSAQLLSYVRATHFTRASFDENDLVVEPFLLMAHIFSGFLGAALVLKHLVMSLTSLMKEAFIKMFIGLKNLTSTERKCLALEQFKRIKKKREVLRSWLFSQPLH